MTLWKFDLTSNQYGLHHLDCLTVHHVSIRLDENCWRSYQEKKVKSEQIRYTVTSKDYENLVYCNLAAILQTFVSNNKQITTWLDENYRSEMRLKSCLINL